MVAAKTKDKTDPLVMQLLKHDLPCIMLPGTWGLLSNEPRDSTINYVGRSTIRRQTSHCKGKSPLIVPPLPQILAETYRMAQFTCVDGLRQDWGNES